MRSPLHSSPRWPASLLALAAAAMAALTGCASGPPPQSAGPVPVITGPFGKDPSITIPSASPSRQLIVRTLLAGGGPVVRPGDYVVFLGAGSITQWAYALPGELAARAK